LDEGDGHVDLLQRRQLYRPDEGNIYKGYICPIKQSESCSNLTFSEYCGNSPWNGCWWGKVNSVF